MSSWELKTKSCVKGAWSRLLLALLLPCPNDANVRPANEPESCFSPGVAPPCPACLMNNVALSPSRCVFLTNNHQCRWCFLRLQEKAVQSSNWRPDMKVTKWNKCNPGQIKCPQTYRLELLPEQICPSFRVRVHSGCRRTLMPLEGCETAPC